MRSKNPINVSGYEGEKRIKDFLISEDISFIHGGFKRGVIDFRINTPNGIMYADSKNQNDGGSVDEKIPHTSFKYAKKYNTNHIIIVRGDHDYPKSVYKHLEALEECMGIKTEVFTFDEFKNLFSDNTSVGILEQCMN